MSATAHPILKQKLDSFVRKYYQNKLIRGGIYACGLLLMLLLVLLLGEWFGQFGVGLRTVLFYTWWMAFVVVSVAYILLPLSKLFRIGPILTDEEAAKIIGKHFPEVADKLLNTLQLQARASEEGTENQALILASIDQRTQSLSPIPFVQAINLTENKRYAWLALVPLTLLLGIWASFPSALGDAAYKLVQHRQYFEKPMPYVIRITNAKLEGVQGNDATITVEVNGSTLPDALFLELKEDELKMDKSNKQLFSYTLHNLQETFSFSLMADGYRTKPYEFRVIPNPSLVSFDVAIEPPPYTLKPKETLSNVGDVTVPTGSRITWKLRATHAQQLLLDDGKIIRSIEKIGENTFQISQRYLEPQAFSVRAANQWIKAKEALPFHVNLIPDQFPTVQVEERIDSLSPLMRFFRVELKDDYGFSRLELAFQVEKGSEKKQALQRKKLSINTGVEEQQLVLPWNIGELNLEPGDDLTYYFEVWDNDGVHGPKSSRSPAQRFHASTLEELAAKAERSADKTRSDLQETLKSSREIQKEIQELNKKLLDKKLLSYEEIKRLNALMNKQQQLEQKIQQIQNEQQKQQAEQQQFSPKEENPLVEKQKQLEDLFNQVVPEELKEKMKELQELLKNMDKEKVQEKLEEMKWDARDMEKELDRSLQVFKQLEFEQKLKSTTDKIDELAKRQEDLAKQTEEKQENSEDLKKAQDELNKEAEQLKEDLKKLDEKAKEAGLEDLDQLGEKMEEKRQDLAKDMESSSNQLQQKKNKKASENQKTAAQKMKQMSAQLNAMASESEDEQQEEDMNALREILENLIRLSFGQEDLIKRLGQVDRQNPLYVKITQEQKKLKDDARMIEDSLYALSKRQAQIAPLVNREIAEINKNMEKAIAKMAERQVPEAMGRQQYVMTATNNLALMLSESLEQMQQQMQMKSSGSGKGKCQKPGGSGSGKGSKPSAAQMKKMQEQINQQIEKLKSQMEKEKAQQSGGKKDGKKPGEKGQKGGGGQEGGSGTSEQLAKLAAQQEALRRALQQQADLLNKDGKQGNGSLQKLAEKMEQTESDIVNKRITQETIRRQQDILTRLLEAENAERERELDKKRESNEAKNQLFGNPNQFFEYKLLKQKEAELLKAVPPALTPFYKNKVNNYFNSFSK